MTPITIPCPTCASTGTDTHEDRHTEARMDICRTCGGKRFIPARTGETPEASFLPLSTAHTATAGDGGTAEKFARSIAASKIGSADPAGLRLPEDVWRQALPEAQRRIEEVLAQAPAVEAPAGEEALQEVERLIRVAMQSEMMQYEESRVASRHETAKATARKIALVLAASSTPTDVQPKAASPVGEDSASEREEREHVRQTELQEIADGAFGDNPMVRGLAHDRLAKNAAALPAHPSTGQVEDLTTQPYAWVLLDQRFRAPDDCEDFEAVVLASEVTHSDLKRFVEAGRASPLYLATPTAPDRIGQAGDVLWEPTEQQLHAAMDAFYPGEDWQNDLGCALETSLRDMRAAIVSANRMAPVAHSTTEQTSPGSKIISGLKQAAAHAAGDESAARTRTITVHHTTGQETLATPRDGVAREALSTIDVHEEASEYELRADGDYKPNEFEQQLLEDFGCGLIAKVEDALRLTTPPSAQEPGTGDTGGGWISQKQVDDLARMIAAAKIGSKDRTGANLPDDIWQQALPEARERLAVGSPTPATTAETRGPAEGAR